MAFGTSLPTLHTPNVGTGCTFYVDAVNGNDSWTGTVPAFTSGTTGPWQTAAKAFTYLRSTHVWVAGKDNLVYLRNIDGTASYQAASGTATIDMDYNDATRRPNTNQWVIWSRYPGDFRPKIKPAIGTTGAKYGIRTQITTANFQVFTGLEFDGEQIIRGDGDVAGLYLGGTPQNIDVVDCISHGHRANYVANGGGGARKAQGIFVEPGAGFVGVAGGAVSNINITRCLIYDNGDTAGTLANLEHGIYAQANGMRMWENVIYNHPNGFAIQCYNGGAVQDGTTIASNTLVGTGLTSAGSTGKSCLILHPSATNFVVKNNIMAFAKEYGIEWEPGTGGAGSGDVLDRNIIFGNGLGTYEFAPPTGWTVTNASTSDPKFVDSASRNFHLLSSSPAIGAGDDTYMSSTDFDGVARTSTGDIGAFEFVASAATNASRLMLGVG